MTFMKSASAAVFALAMAEPAQASTVFESFPNFAVAGDSVIDVCTSCGGAGELFASFTLSSAQTLNKAFALVSSFSPSGSLIPMTVSIFGDGGDDLPARTGTGAILNPLFYLTYTSPSSVTLDPFRTNGGMANYVVEFSLPDWQVSAGKYWIRFAGPSNLMPLYNTATPSHSRVVGSDFFLEGRNITFNPPAYAIGFSLNGVDVAPPGGVPEPASWAFMLAGFGLAGVALRRTAKVAASLA